MPFVNKSDVITGSRPPIFPAGAEVVAQRAQINAVAADVAAGSVGAFLILPAGCVPVAYYCDADAAIAADIGIVNDAETAISTAAVDGGGAWFAGQNFNTPTTSNATPSSRALSRVQPVQYDRKVGIRVTSAGAAGVLGMLLMYRAA